MSVPSLPLAPTLDTSAAVPLRHGQFVVGLGAGVFVSRHWSIQPDVRTAFVTRHDHAYTRTTATVRVAYHFEDHPVTPSVR